VFTKQLRSKDQVQYKVKKMLEYPRNIKKKTLTTNVETRKINQIFTKK